MSCLHRCAYRVSVQVYMLEICEKASDKCFSLTKLVVAATVQLCSVFPLRKEALVRSSRCAYFLAHITSGPHSRRLPEFKIQVFAMANLTSDLWEHKKGSLLLLVCMKCVCVWDVNHSSGLLLFVSASYRVQPVQFQQHIWCFFSSVISFYWKTVTLFYITSFFVHLVIRCYQRAYVSL